MIILNRDRLPTLTEAELFEECKVYTTLENKTPTIRCNLEAKNRFTSVFGWYDYIVDDSIDFLIIE